MSLLLIVGFTLSNCGCQLMTPSVIPSPPPDTAAISKNVGPKRTPKPATVVAMAKVKEEQAKTAEDPSTQVKLRDESRHLYQEAIKIDANYLPAHLGLARVYTRLRDYDRALAAYDKATKTFPKEGIVWQELALCHNSRGDWDNGVKCLKKALECEPENRQFSNLLGLTLARVGQLDQSLAILSKGYGPAQGHYTLACALYQMKQDEPCKAHLRHALAVNPAHQAARDMLAELDGTSATPSTTAQPTAVAPASSAMPAASAVSSASSALLGLQIPMK